MYLDLGHMPLANNLCDSAEEALGTPRWPLQVCFCADCYQSQLSVVVDPTVLFRYYTYRSSISRTFAKHCRRMAVSLGNELDLGPQDLLVDIAGNDGTLLHEFREKLGVRVLNIEPAQNISAISRTRKIATIQEFWSSDVSKKILTEHGRAKLVTATNVFAHVDDVQGFLAAIKQCLAPDGILVLEFPYLVDLLRNNEFDTVYFEHLSYFLIAPLVSLMDSLGMKISHVEHHDIHGGSVRVFVVPHSDVKPSASVDEFMSREQKEGYHEVKTYIHWASQVRNVIEEVSTSVTDLKQQTASVAAFGASAKGNTLLNTCQLNTELVDYIVDDTPEKIGRLSPGTGIPIVSRKIFDANAPDYLLLLAWNFADDIMASTSDYRRRGGKYLIPIPHMRIV